MIKTYHLLPSKVVFGTFQILPSWVVNDKSIPGSKNVVNCMQIECSIYLLFVSKRLSFTYNFNPG